MTMLMFSMRDAKAESWGLPFFQITRATAMREIQMKLESDEHLKRFCHDFALYEVGEWEPTNGENTGVFPGSFVIEVSELLPKDDDA